MIWNLLIGVTIGAVAGGLIGSLRTCTDGGCPLTANPKRGAIWGAILGLVAVLATAQAGTPATSATNPPQTTAVTQLVSTEDWQHNVLDRPGRSVVYFHAEWCSACKAFSPALEGFADEHSPAVRFYEVDVDKEPKLANECKIEYLPTVIVFGNGKETARHVGLATGDELGKMLR